MVLCGEDTAGERRMAGAFSLDCAETTGRYTGGAVSFACAGATGRTAGPISLIGDGRRDGRDAGAASLACADAPGRYTAGPAGLDGVDEATARYAGGAVSFAWAAAAGRYTGGPISLGGVDAGAGRYAGDAFNPACRGKPFQGPFANPALEGEGLAFSGGICGFMFRAR